jgi:hypothetical protein
LRIADVIGRLPSAHDPQNDHEQDRSDQTANEYEPSPRTAQDHVTAAPIVGIVILRESLCGTFSDHVPPPVHLLNRGGAIF